MENNSGANLRKEKDIVRGDIGVYVIPALRNKRMNNLQISSEEISTKPENKDDDKKMFSDELNDSK